MINIFKFIKNTILKIIKQMALENKKLSAYDDLASANIDTTTKLVVLTGATKVNNNLPVTNFIEDSLTSTSVVKPLSAKQGKTLQDTKAPIANPTFTGAVNGITKSMVGLGNVDNTSDANKPISTAQAAGLAPKDNPTFTGVVSGIRENILIHPGTITLGMGHDNIIVGPNSAITLPTAVGISGKKYTFKLKAISDILSTATVTTNATSLVTIAGGNCASLGIRAGDLVSIDGGANLTVTSIGTNTFDVAGAPAAGGGKTLTVYHKIDASSNETIDGINSITLLTAYEKISIISDGSSWLTI